MLGRPHWAMPCGSGVFCTTLRRPTTNILTQEFKSGIRFREHVEPLHVPVDSRGQEGPLTVLFQHSDGMKSASLRLNGSNLRSQAKEEDGRTKQHAIAWHGCALEALENDADQCRFEAVDMILYLQLPTPPFL